MHNPIFPCLWFDGKAKEAADFYCSVFTNSRILQETPMVVMFEMNGSKFMGLNGGPQFPFTEAVSLVVNCDTQDEIDYFWNRLTADGGKESRCGWLKDKYGLSWQIVPSNIGQLMSDPEKANRVMQVILQMNKLDIEKIRQA